MNSGQRRELLAFIEDFQGGNEHVDRPATAPVSMQIGTSYPAVSGDSLTITSAPSAVTEAVIGWVQEYRRANPAQPLLTVDITPSGLKIS